MTGDCPLITCRLTDRCGDMINPYDSGSIVYTTLPFTKDRKKIGDCSVPVAVEGYVAVYSDEKRISPPIPFCILESVRLSLPPKGFLTFWVRDFHCCAVPCRREGSPDMAHIKLIIRIESAAAAKKAVSLLVPQVNPNLHEIDRVCIHTNMLCDCVRFHSGLCLSYQSAALRAEVSQYNTIADGIKRTYRDIDELKEYGDQGILSPLEVSYYGVFVNGVLQSKTNYILTKGELTFTTQEVPAKGRPIIILFTTWKDFCGQIMHVTNWQYNAVSDGTKKIYTDADEIKEYGDHGIPSPSEVSYFNLYVNGVLQPKVTYRVRKGVLELTTSDAPTKGTPVILESIVIRDPEGRLFRTEIHAYNAYSNGGKIYTSQDEIQMYGTNGIPGQSQRLYQNLFINAVIQPPVNYLIQKGYLILNTTDNPTVGAPITLQYVNGIYPESCGEMQMSDAALAQWKKVYCPIIDPCEPTRFQQENKSE